MRRADSSQWCEVQCGPAEFVAHLGGAVGDIYACRACFYEGVRYAVESESAGGPDPYIGEPIPLSAWRKVAAPVVIS